MRGNTYVAEYELVGLPALDTSAATYSFSFGAGVSASLNESSVWKKGGSYGGGGAQNDAPILESVRILSNFADGFVWTSGCTAVFQLWHGAPIVFPALPAGGLYYHPRTLNEWNTVEMPLPRASNVGVYGGVSFAAVGAFVFNIAGISDDFNGAEVLIRLQCQFRAATW